MKIDLAEWSARCTDWQDGVEYISVPREVMATLVEVARAAQKIHGPCGIESCPLRLSLAAIEKEG